MKFKKSRTTFKRVSLQSELYIVIIIGIIYSFISAAGNTELTPGKLIAQKFSKFFKVNYFIFGRFFVKSV